MSDHPQQPQPSLASLFSPSPRSLLRAALAVGLAALGALIGWLATLRLGLPLYGLLSQQIWPHTLSSAHLPLQLLLMYVPALVICAATALVGRVRHDRPQGYVAFIVGILAATTYLYLTQIYWNAGVSGNP